MPRTRMTVRAADLQPLDRVVSVDGLPPYNSGPFDLVSRWEPDAHDPWDTAPDSRCAGILWFVGPRPITHLMHCPPEAVVVVERLDR